MPVIFSECFSFTIFLILKMRLLCFLREVTRRRTALETRMVRPGTASSVDTLKPCIKEFVFSCPSLSAKSLFVWEPWWRYSNGNAGLIVNSRYYTGGLNHLFGRINFSILGHGMWFLKIVFHFYGMKKL